VAGEVSLKEVKLLDNLAVFICLVISVLVGVSGGVILTMFVIYLIVKSYGQIISYISDLKVYVDLN
jgi:uncharacterized membrane protein